MPKNNNNARFQQKIVRKNILSQKKTLKILKKKKSLEEFGKKTPKIVVFINLSPYTNIKFLKELSKKVSFSSEILQKGKPNLVHIQEKGQSFILWFSPRDKVAILDISKVADILIFVCTPDPDIKTGKLNFDLGFFDEVPEILKILRSQGIPHVVPVIQGLCRFNKKQRNILFKAYKHYFTNEFSNSNNIFSIDDTKQLVKLWSFLCLKRHFKVDWRHRSFLLAQSTKFTKSNNEDLNFQVIGHLRGERSLNINQLIHITGLGDFHVAKVEVKTTTNIKTNMLNDPLYNTKNIFSLLAINNKKVKLINFFF